MEMHVELRGRGSYGVSSESKDGVTYGVRNVDGVWVCSCPHFSNRDVRECKHIKRVREDLFSGEIEIQRGMQEYYPLNDPCLKRGKTEIENSYLRAVFDVMCGLFPDLDIVYFRDFLTKEIQRREIDAG